MSRSWRISQEGWMGVIRLASRLANSYRGSSGSCPNLKVHQRDVSHAQPSAGSQDFRQTGAPSSRHASDGNELLTRLENVAARKPLTVAKGHKDLSNRSGQKNGKTGTESPEGFETEVSTRGLGKEATAVRASGLGSHSSCHNIACSALQMESSSVSSDPPPAWGRKHMELCPQPLRPPRNGWQDARGVRVCFDAPSLAGLHFLCTR